jgi:predicted outer membrane protein
MTIAVWLLLATASAGAQPDEPKLTPPRPTIMTYTVVDQTTIRIEAPKMAGRGPEHGP